MAKKQNTWDLPTVNTKVPKSISKFRPAIQKYIKKNEQRIKAEKTPKRDYSSLARLDPNRIFAIILALLLLFALIAGLTGTQETRTFAGFLEYLSQFESIPLDWLQLGSTQIEGDWGIFEFLKNFLETFASASKAIAWFGLSIVNALIFILKLAHWVFFGY